MSQGRGAGWYLADAGRRPIGARKEMSGFRGRTRALLIGAALVVAPLFVQGVSPATAATPGLAWAWGWNRYGQLGDNTATDRHGPVHVSGLAGTTAIASGTVHSLAVKSDGTVSAWGWNRYGQLGDNTTTDRRAPVQVFGLSGAVSVAGGGNHSLALKSDGTVWAWGWNGYGQLGDNTTTDRYKPVQVLGLTGVVAVAGGGYHSLAVKSDGTVWAWGTNYIGQLGDNTMIDRHAPVQVPGLTGGVAVAAGSAHSLVVKSDGTAWAWGNNDYSQLGDRSTIARYAPVPVSGLEGAIGVAGGGYHSLALKSDGTVWAWGNNDGGQLGDRTTFRRFAPVQVFGLAGAVAVAAGEIHSLAVESDGTVWSWGSNGYGQLGDATTTSQMAPVQLCGMRGAMAVAAGGRHSLALTSAATAQAASLIVAPKADTNPVGSNHAVTATAKDALGQAAAGVAVRFSVTGANTASGCTTTDDNGHATFTYAGTRQGSDTITAYADNNINGIRDPGEPSDTASKFWTPLPAPVGKNTYCTDIDPSWLQLRIDAVKDGRFSDGILTVDISGTLVNPLSGGAVRFDWSSNIGVAGVIVRGGGTADNFYRYEPPARSGRQLAADDVSSDIGAAFFCYPRR
jgi:hypothetical protein